ncbi:hypothetical protein REPUB_Repub01dG0083400 [Reevesia pubescens]
MTSYNLISTIYGYVKYVPRSFYAYRENMLQIHAIMVAGNSGNVVHCNDIIDASLTTQAFEYSNFMQMDAPKGNKSHSTKVVIVNEGAGDAVALLGLFCLVNYFYQDHLLGRKRAFNFVVDSGTTAGGLGIGVMCLGLPWKSTAVMLADTIDAYREQVRLLISEFKRQFYFLPDSYELNGADDGILHWVDLCHPRKFCNILEGEIEACQQIAQQTGILVDPVCTLSACEMATKITSAHGDAIVVMLHTGGTLDMFGLVQRSLMLWEPQNCRVNFHFLYTLLEALNSLKQEPACVTARALRPGA